MSKKGFTLIELLVVIAIISLLAAIIFASLSNASARSRDVRRLEDLHEIQNALELYASSFRTLPQPSTYSRANHSPGYWDGWWDLSSNTASPSFMNFLVTAKMISQVPVDPLNSPSSADNTNLSANGMPNATGYRYFYYIAPQGYTYDNGSCVVNNGITYMIGISQFETDSVKPSTVFKGSSCPCLWQTMPNYFLNQFAYIICGTV